MEEKQLSSQKSNLRARVREFYIPPVRDGLVLGKDAPIGFSALRKALHLLSPVPYDHIEIEDDVVRDVLIRAKFLRRFCKGQLIDFVLRRVKPLMGPDEILHLDLELEIFLEDQGVREC
jgi:hypothetical protein